MSRPAKTVATLALLLFLGGLAAADAYYGEPRTASVTDGGVTTPDPALPADPGDGGDGPADAPAGGVAPDNGIGYQAAAAQAGVELTPNQENSMIAPFVQDMSPASFAVLINGDRAGSIVCADGGRSKEALIAVKEALIPAFSGNVKNLKDETVQIENQPVRNELSFEDAAIFADGAVIIVRSRQRICEMRAKREMEGTLREFLNTLMTGYGQTGQD